MGGEGLEVLLGSAGVKLRLGGAKETEPTIDRQDARASPSKEIYFDPVFTIRSSHEKLDEERSKKRDDQWGKIKDKRS